MEVEAKDEAICVISYTSGALGFTNRGFTPMGYKPAPSITYEEWMADGELIRAMDRFKNFAMGDWLTAGERKFGETYAQAYDEFRWGSMDKLKKLAWVARSVPAEVRREELTWSHHHYVAAMSFDEQRDWLQYAVESELSANELRELIKSTRGSSESTAETVADGPDYPPVIEMAQDDSGTYVVDREPDTIPVGSAWDHEGTDPVERPIQWYDDEEEEEDDPIPDTPGGAAKWLFDTHGASWCRRMLTELYAVLSRDTDDVEVDAVYAD